jgi:PAS domain S-box-containing protein
VEEAKHIRVLVVEDNPTQANLLRMSLRRRVLFVECVFSLKEALHRIPLGDIDVILLDLSLPDSDGIQTFYELYAVAGQIPIVVLTGLNDQSVAYEALNNGAQDYLIKGVPSDESVIRCLRYAIQRQRFETELWQSERRTRLILENAQDAFFAMDESGMVVTWNVQAEKLFGYLRKDALGEPLVGLMIPLANRKEFNRQIRAFLHGQSSSIVNSRVEMSLKCKDGHEFPAEVAIFSIKEGQEHTLCGFVRDVSHRKEMDDKIRSQLEQRLVDQMAQLERSNNQLQRYNRTISEELRKPLQKICQETLALRESIARSGDRQNMDSIRSVCMEVEKVMALLDPQDDSTTTAVRHSTISRANVASMTPIPKQA